MTAPEFATATEREALGGFLDLQRAALVRKVQGVGDADARTAPTASSLSLLGILKHCTLHWNTGSASGGMPLPPRRRLGRDGVAGLA
jgi:hypothetical protein